MVSTAVAARTQETNEQRVDTKTLAAVSELRHCIVVPELHRHRPAIRENHASVPCTVFEKIRIVYLFVAFANIQNLPRPVMFIVLV